MYAQGLNELSTTSSCELDAQGNNYVELRWLEEWNNDLNRQYSL
jgi:hypothetical protein